MVGFSRLRPRRPELTSTITFLCVAVCCALVFVELQPRLLFMNSVTAGGDMGAHTWAPGYLKDHLLPHGRISGWTPDWYAGFPALTFYFPLPAVLVVLLSYVIPMTIAFKLVTVSGVITLPIAMWAFGRLSRLPFPAPACLVVATLPFLFDTGYTILGGNIASTLAGEYAFSIGLSIAIVFLGVVYRGLYTNKMRALAAVLFGLTVLCHLLPTLLALTGGTLILLMRLATGGRWERVWALVVGRRSESGLEDDPDDTDHSADPPSNTRRQALKWAVLVGVVGGCISAFWALPFVVDSPYMNDMGWEKIGTGVQSGMDLYQQHIKFYQDALFPDGLTKVYAGGTLGAFVGITLRRRVSIFFTLLAVVSAIGFVVMPQGRLWNARLLPFYYLSLYMLCGLLIAEIGWGVPKLLSRYSWGDDSSIGLRYITPVIALVLSLGIVLPTLPTPAWYKLSHSPFHDSTALSTISIPGWATWNYAGYSGKHVHGAYYKPAYPEYQRLIDLMGNVGKTNGCGRAMWEYEPKLDRFGTPMALMLLPTQTQGCIGSMEGLFFESSATVPYHFLNQAWLSQTPSSAMRNLPYGSLNVQEGVTRLALLGVKYYMAVSPEVQAQAAEDPRLSLVASTPAAPGTGGNPRTWNVYEIAGSDLVQPLTNKPAVMSDPDSITRSVLTDDPKTTKDDKKKLSARESWLENSVLWYANNADLDVPLAASGPLDWPRVKNAGETAPRESLPQVKVSEIGTGDDRISFHVDRVGVPVVVRTSDFPNWKVSGAKGPYRITPNLMVVVPTKNDVSLHYGRTLADWAGITLSVAGVVIVITWFGRDRRRRRRNADRTVSAPDQGQGEPEEAALPG